MLQKLQTARINERKKKHILSRSTQTSGNSCKILLAEFNTHCVASYTRMEAEGCANTVWMTEERSHRSSAVNTVEEARFKRNVQDTGTQNSCERTFMQYLKDQRRHSFALSTITEPILAIEDYTFRESYELAIVDVI